MPVPQLSVQAVFLAYRAMEWARASRNVIVQEVPSVEEVSQLLDNMLSLGYQIIHASKSAAPCIVAGTTLLRS